MPAALPVQERVEVPEPRVIEVTVRVQTRLVELAVTARVTVPAKPFNGATVRVEVGVAPALMVTLVGPAETVKS